MTTPPPEEPVPLTGVPAGTPRFHPLQLPSAPFWVVLLGGIAATLVLIASIHALLVFMIGAALSFFLVPIVNWLESKGVPRIGAAVLAVATLVIVTLAVLVVGALILIEQGAAFFKALPSIMTDIQAQIAAANLPSWLRETVDTIGASIEHAVVALDTSSLVLGLLQGVLGMVGFFFSLMLLPFFLFYLLKDQPKMAGTFFRKVPTPWKADVNRMIRIFIEDVATWIKSSVMVGSIMFVIVSIGMFVIGTVVPDAQILASYALLLGLAAFVFETIPQLGPILAYLPALLLALTVSPLAVVVVSAFYFVAFNIEGSILVPTFQGKMISFSGASVLVIITIGFALGGIIGAIFALPVAAVLRDIFGLFFVRAQEFAGVPPERDAMPSWMQEDLPADLAGDPRPPAEPNSDDEPPPGQPAASPAT